MGAKSGPSKRRAKANVLGKAALGQYETAAELWPDLILRAGLTSPRRGKPGPYDVALIEALMARLFPGQAGDFNELIASSSLSAESLLRAFFATLGPFARMKEDILQMLTAAGARASGEKLSIRFAFDPDGDPLDLLLEQFRTQMEQFAEALSPRLPAIKFSDLWNLLRDPSSRHAFFTADPARATQPEVVASWLGQYNSGVSFAPLGVGWETSVPDVDDRIGRVVALLNGMLARFSTYASSRDALLESAWAGDREALDDSGFTIGQLGSIEHDRWPLSVALWICQVHATLAAGDRSRLDPVLALVDEILPEPIGDPVRTIIRALEDLLDLPVWKHRHEVYAVWLGAQIHRALSDARWRFRFHLVDDRLEFAFRGVHLATLIRDEAEPELFWWTELRSEHSDLPNHRRTTGIQPDYRVQRAPLSQADRDVLVLEAKQHIRSSNREFREAIEDYAHACPHAGVLIANHGPCSAKLMTEVAPAASVRSAAHGDIRPDNPSGVEELRDDIVRAVDFSLAGDAAKAFNSTCTVRLTWGEEPADLDLHVFREGGGHVFFERPALDDVLLGADIQNGFGPETAMLSGQSGTYAVVVHQFSADGDLTTSDAVVKISHGPRRDRSRHCFAVPPGSGRWWHVANLDLGLNKLVPVQRRMSEQPYQDKRS